MDIQLEIVDNFNMAAFVNIFNLYHHDRAVYFPELYPHVDEEGFFDRDVAVDLAAMDSSQVACYLIRHEGKFAGFLVASFPPYVKPDTDFCIQDIFILNSHRRLGIAKEACRLLFDDFSGRFCLMVSKNDGSALAFWDALIEESCELISKEADEEDMIVYKFSTS